MRCNPITKEFVLRLPQAEGSPTVVIEIPPYCELDHEDFVIAAEHAKKIEELTNCLNCERFEAGCVQFRYSLRSAQV